jgi:hypothetical protein
MDYLPLPEKATYMLVPDLWGTDFDNEDFVGYDVRQGWHLQSILRGDLSAARDDWPRYRRTMVKGLELVVSSREDDHVYRLLVVQFIQTWLFFGMLHRALGRLISRKDYPTSSLKDTQ